MACQKPCPMCLLSSCYLFSWVILSCKGERRNKQCHTPLLCHASLQASASSQASPQQKPESRSHFTAGFSMSNPNKGSFYLSASMHHLSQKGSYLFLNAPAHTHYIKAMRMCLLVIKNYSSATAICCRNSTGQSKFLMPRFISVRTFPPSVIQYENPQNQELRGGFGSGLRLWGEFKVVVLQRRRGTVKGIIPCICSLVKYCGALL